MKIIKHSDIVSLNISAVKYMDWVQDMLLRQYDAVLPAKISIALPDSGFFNTMPCYIPNSEVFGVKVVNRFIHNNPALDATLLLYNSVTGQLDCVMDATLITSMRTGAVAATSILKLKVSNTTNKMSIMGLGATARATMLCLLETAKDEYFEVKLMKYKDQAENFVERFKDFPNVKFTVVDSYKDLIFDADIVLSCIASATHQIGEDSWFKEGVVVVPVHTRGFQNCDLFFDKVYGDLREQIEHFGYFDQFKYFNEFAKVIIGDDAGRESDTERILVYNIGIALNDIFIGNEINNMFIENENCEVSLKEIIDKFYI